MTDWFTGQTVECVAGWELWRKARWRILFSFFRGGRTLPRKGARYKISSIHAHHGKIFLRLAGIGEGFEFIETAFRPLVESKNDISIFVRILDRVNRRKTEDA